ncbi:MAG: aminotransferase class V-fold PLP-dependent enzyme, partial [Candidatus Tectimicrobiota bacterium]
MSTEETIYLDNAATSYPKPESVYEAVDHVLRQLGASPGRGAHRLAVEGQEVLALARQRLAELFSISEPDRIVFTKNATGALNLAIKGCAGQGGHDVTTALEHNSVMRPLNALRARGLKVTRVRVSPGGRLDLRTFQRAIRRATRIVVATHASNVTGALLPIADIGAICRAKGVPFCVDAAQTAGVVDIDVERDAIDLLACPGHKGLLGPQGTGFLYVRPGVEVEPLMEGGTGSISEREEQPPFYPDRLQSGTPNTPGIAGLASGVEYITTTGIDKIHRKELELIGRLLEELKGIQGVIVHGPKRTKGRVAVVSFALKGTNPSEVGYILDEAFGIIVRTGLHCAPGTHKLLGTYPEG